VVFAFLAITAARWAAVGPAHNGPYRAGGAHRPRTRLTPRGIAAVALVVVAIGVLVGTSRVVPDAPATGGSPPNPASAARPPLQPSAQGSLPPADSVLAAQGTAFVEQTLTAPAGRPFRVAFDNRDNVPHNLEIRDATGKVLFMGDIVTGPTVTVYDVPALPAGQYPFVCTVHPAMTGTLTVK
jgi:plastocyanin